MYISLNWVREFCPFQTSEPPLRVGERFSLSTAEVEGVHGRGENLRLIVAARVLEAQPIAGSDHLTQVQVEIAKGSRLAVVCGAPNVRAGMLAPLALPGTRIGDQVIARTSIRGVLSEGMLLSEAELGFTDRHEGILELPARCSPGTPLDQVFPADVDILLEIDNKSLTHRPDLWGHYGIAREFSTIYRVPLKPYAADESLAAAAGSPEVAVRIEAGQASERCRRYCGLRIDGVRVGPSPDWLQHRLFAVGSRPINNIVDVTNYVLHELGQPLHAFDRQKIRGSKIIVRMAREGELFKLLDGREVALCAEDLLIADGAGPVALAGVMGGENSSIGDGTTSLFLESANFNAASVRKSSLRHGRTESSARFEKSLDPLQARAGILRAARMILDLCPGATVVGPLQDPGFRPPEPLTIPLEPEFISHRLGSAIGAGEVKDILTWLGFKIEERGEKKPKGSKKRWTITVPSWRATRDVSIKEDLVEEVGRIYGYGRIVPSAPSWPVVAPAVNERRQFERQVKSFLSLHGGLAEVFTYSMVGLKHCLAFGLDPEAHLKLKNPTSEELDRLRREIIPIHLEKARDNLRFFDRFGFFEVGRIYLKDPKAMARPAQPVRPAPSEPPLENTRIAGLLAFPEKCRENFYQARHLVLALAEFLGLERPEIAPMERARSWMHPKAAAELRAGGQPAGGFYRIHPGTLRQLEIEGDVLAFDLDFDRLFEAVRRETRYKRLPRFPAVPFDVAVLVPERTPAGDLLPLIRQAAGPALEQVEVFDVYEEAGLPPGKKSIAYHLVFRSEDHTLTEKDIGPLQNAVIQALAGAGYPLRS
ncbi:MAG: phenylalanine--tRNA ligase subunit beta [Planctomycetes bacterium]|nr:phenylalanine--tRNA ligase subunit beta [Planctomycetota bacterium]